jgi:hypothetical protein
MKLQDPYCQGNTQNKTTKRIYANRQRIESKRNNMGDNGMHSRKI